MFFFVESCESPKILFQFLMKRFDLVGWRRRINVPCMMLLAISRNGANENEKTNEPDPDVFCMFKIRHFRIHISEGFVRHIRIELELTLPCRLIFQPGHRDAGAVSIAIRPARDCWTRRFFRCCFLIAWLGSFLFWELRFYEFF